MSTYGLGRIDERRTKSGRIRYRVRLWSVKRNGYVTVGTYDTRHEAEGMRDGALVAREQIGIGCTLEQLGEAWLETIAHQKAARSVRSTWRHMVSAAGFYREPLDTITVLDIESWIASFRTMRIRKVIVDERGKRIAVPGDRPYSRQMWRHALKLLKLALDYACKRGIITANPARLVKLPRAEQIEDGWTFLTLAEIERVLSLPHLSRLQRAVFGLAIYSGLRAGELACLRWERVHLDTVPARAEIRESYTGGTKTNRPRTIPLLPAAIELLRTWQPDPKKRAGLVFPGPKGQPYESGHRWGWDVRDRGRKDVPTQAGIARRVRWHDLRHSTASHLVSGSWGRAWTLAEVAAYLGHTRPDQTSRYAHLCPDALARAAAETTGHRPTVVRLASTAADQAREITRESVDVAQSCEG